jgi:hypothetical protein
MNRPSSLAVARNLFTLNFRYFAAVWLLVFVVAALILAGIAVFGEPDTSILNYTTLAPRYWMLSAGIVVTAACLRPYIAHGVTREHLTWGATLAVILVCLILAAAMAAAYYGEYLVFSAAGWHYDVADGHMFASGAEVGRVFIEFALILAVHFFAGWAMASNFVRFGVWTAISLIPVTYLPALVTETALGVSWSGRIWIDELAWSLPPVTLGVVVGVAMTAVLILANRWLLREAAVSAKPA